METPNIKLVLLAGLILLNVKFTSAQKSGSNCVTQGAVIVDAYYGYPYVMGKILKEITNSNSSTTEISKTVNYNHLGGKFEYMISDHFGMGLDYTFARVTNYISNLDYNNNDGHYRITHGAYKESLTKQRVLVRMNIHFGTTNTLDPYVSFGGGYKQTVYKNNFPNDFPINKININLIPISFRAAIGMRWFFEDNIGLNIEAGLGGPVIQGGVTVKF